MSKKDVTLGNDLNLNPNASVKEQLEALELQEKLEKRQEMLERKAQQDGIRQNQLRAVRAQMAEREAIQAACPHMKPNFQPAIGGQRDHGNHYHWICQYCNKGWLDNELPMHLRISADRVGGPQV